MQIEVSTAKDEQCALCGGQLDRSPGSTTIIVDNKRYHIGCSSQMREAHWLFHSLECPTCKGRGRVAPSDYRPLPKSIESR